MTPDSELLRHFAKTNSEDAFAELVKRHVNLVYSAALRQVGGDAHLAQDVAQTVFTDLARKAGSLARRETLTGWLYTSAHFAAAKIARTENRRHDREEKFMRELTNENAPELDWEKIRPTLDEVMHELKETDREAILLRYFENRQFAEVGAKLGLNENAARMRVERALEKLRAVFARRGITTATALASVISANAVQIAPANLAATMTAASIASAGAGTVTLLKIMTATNLKLGISALVVAGAATAFVIQHQALEKLHSENESLKQQIVQMQTDNESLPNRLAEIGDAKKLSDEQFNELLKLRGEVGVLRQQLQSAKQLNESQQASGQAITNGVEISQEDYFRLRQQDIRQALGEIVLTIKVYVTEHSGAYPTNLMQLVEPYHRQGSHYLSSAEFPGGIKMDDFELLNVGLLKQDNPSMLMIREKNPRRRPDDRWADKWERYYFAECCEWLAYSTDGNFDDWEKAHSVSNNK
jgi:RNA polymerase sigma factor (sigma-70 family)